MPECRAERLKISAKYAAVIFYNANCRIVLCGIRKWACYWDTSIVSEIGIERDCVLVCAPVPFMLLFLVSDYLFVNVLELSADNRNGIDIARAFGENRSLNGIWKFLKMSRHLASYDVNLFYLSVT
jgi:hypothetical protein